MMSARRRVIGVVDAQVGQFLAHGFGAHTLLASLSHEKGMHLIVELVRVSEYAIVYLFDILTGSHEQGTAESTDVGEKVEMLQRDLQRLVSPPRETRHGTVVTIVLRAERLLHIRHQILEHHILERGAKLVTLLTTLSAMDIAAIAIVHHYYHRLATTAGNGIVHDVGHEALLMPSTFVLAHTMLQIEHRVLLIGIGLVFSGGVDVTSSGFALHAGEVLAFSHLSMIDTLLVGIVSGIFRALWYLQSTRNASATIESVGTRIGHLYTIYPKKIIVEAYHQRVCSDRPCAVGVFRHGVFAAADVRHHLFRLWGAQLEDGPPLAVYLWILCHGHVILTHHGCLRHARLASQYQQRHHGKSQNKCSFHIHTSFD